MTADVAGHAGTGLAAAKPLSGARRWGTLGILLALSVLAYVDRSIIALMVQPIKAALGVSDFQIGLVHGLAFALFYSFCALPLGWAIDRFPRRPIIYLGVTIWSLASAGCGLAQNFWHLLFMRFGVGVGAAALNPAAYTILSDIFPRHRMTTAIAVFSLGASIGSGLAMALGGVVVGLAQRELALPLLGALDAWRLVFIITGLPGVVMALLVLLIPRQVDLARGQQPAKVKGAPGQVTALLRGRWAYFTCSFIGYGGMSLMASGTVAWLPTYLIRAYQWTSAQAGVAVGVTVLSLTLGSLTGGLVVDALVKRGRRDAHMAYFCVSSVVCGVFGVLAFMAPSPGISLGLLGICLWMSAVGGVGAGAMQLVTPPHLRGQISGIYLIMLNLLGGGCGPLVVASFTDFLFRDEARVGSSIALTYVVVTPIVLTCFVIGRRLMPAAMADAESRIAAT